MAQVHEGALAGLESFDAIHIDYEHAYKNNAFKRDCAKYVISKLAPNSRVLDVGCGTGVPVSQMLAEAGHDVTGFDVSPKMIHHAQTRVKGAFSAADMLSYEPEGKFAAVFIIYAHHQMSYADFHAAVYKYAETLQPGGFLAFGGSPSDDAVKPEERHLPYVEAYPSFFWGEPMDHLFMSSQGQRDFFTSMGLEIVYDETNVFQPNNPKSSPETQQYIVVKRLGDKPLPPPQPLPKGSN